MATADGAAKRRYADYIRDKAPTLLGVLVLDAVDALFPVTISIADLLKILETVDVSVLNHGLGLDYIGPKLVSRLCSAADAEQLLSGVLRLEAILSPANEEGTFDDSPFLATIEASGRWLLEQSPTRDAPISAIDAVLCLGRSGRDRPRQRSNGPDSDIFALLQSTPERRRAALWRAAERFADAKLQAVTEPWQLQIHGFAPELEPEDLEWLLDDAATRRSEGDRRLAINAAMRLWRQSGSDAAVLRRIETVAASDAAVAAAVAEWTRPRSPSEEEEQRRQRMRHLERRKAVQTAERDRSWVEFADQLRRDPEQLRKIAPPGENGIDARLFHIWQLLNAVGTNRSRYAVDDLSPLELMLGPAVVAAARDAFIGFWRHWRPRLRSQRPPDRRNVISSLDCVGIVGVTLESVQRADWAARLSHEEAVLAAIYATLELNGFPKWLVVLTAVQPDAVRKVLTLSMAPDLTSDSPEQRRDALQDIARADEAITRLLADQLCRLVEARGELPAVVLEPVLRIIQRGLTDRNRLGALLLARFEASSLPETQLTYVAALFEVDAHIATTALIDKLATMSGAAQTALVQSLLAEILGGRRGGASIHGPYRSTASKG